MGEINNDSQSRIKLLSLYSPKTDKRDDSKNKQTHKKNPTEAIQETSGHA